MDIDAAGEEFDSFFENSNISFKSESSHEEETPSASRIHVVLFSSTTAQDQPLAGYIKLETFQPLPPGKIVMRIETKLQITRGDSKGYFKSVSDMMSQEHLGKFSKTSLLSKDSKITKQTKYLGMKEPCELVTNADESPKTSKKKYLKKLSEEGISPLFKPETKASVISNLFQEKSPLGNTSPCPSPDNDGVFSAETGSYTTIQKRMSPEKKEALNFTEKVAALESIGQSEETWTLYENEQDLFEFESEITKKISMILPFKIDLNSILTHSFLGKGEALSNGHAKELPVVMKLPHIKTSHKVLCYFLPASGFKEKKENYYLCSSYFENEAIFSVHPSLNKLAPNPVKKDVKVGAKRKWGLPCLPFTTTLDVQVNIHKTVITSIDKYIQVDINFGQKVKEYYSAIVFVLYAKVKCSSLPSGPHSKSPKSHTEHFRLLVHVSSLTSGQHSVPLAPLMGRLNTVHSPMASIDYHLDIFLDGENKNKNKLIHSQVIEVIATGKNMYSMNYKQRSNFYQRLQLNSDKLGILMLPFTDVVLQPYNTEEYTIKDTETGNTS